VSMLLSGAWLQVSRLHHLASTGCRPGIFSPPVAAAAAAAGAAREAPAVAGQPLEQHLRAAAKQQVRRPAAGHMQEVSCKPLACFLQVSCSHGPQLVLIYTFVQLPLSTSTATRSARLPRTWLFSVFNLNTS
jgi:hypothetical protein